MDLIRINRLEKYRDGGSIGLFGMIDTDEYKLNKKDEPIIIIDYSIGSKEKGQWYSGWKNKGGELINDDSFKDKVRESIKNNLKYQIELLKQI
jgi:hypothetical protein